MRERERERERDAFHGSKGNDVEEVGTYMYRKCLRDLVDPSNSCWVPFER